jgi:hypothetical protein
MANEEKLDLPYLIVQPEETPGKRRLVPGSRLLLCSVGSPKWASPFHARVISAEPSLLELFKKRLREHYVLLLKFPRFEPLLTVDLLRSKVLPVLEAIAAIERLVNPTAELPPRIVSLTQNSPVEVSMDGIADAYKAVREDIIPWRREHEKELARLEEHERAAEIAGKKAEVAESEARSAKERAEAQRILADANRLHAEAEKMRFELKKAKVELAFIVIDKLKPGATEIERLELFARLLPQLETLSLPEPTLIALSAAAS